MIINSSSLNSVAVNSSKSSLDTGFSRVLEDEFSVGDVLEQKYINNLLSFVYFTENLTFGGSKFFETLEDSSVFSLAMVEGIGFVLEDGVVLEDNIGDTLRLLGVLADLLSFEMTSQEQAVFREGLISGIVLALISKEGVGTEISSQVLLLDDADVLKRMIASMLDILRFEHAAASWSKFFETFTDTTTFADVFAQGYGATITDSVSLADVLANIVKFFEALLDNIVLSDTLSNKLVLWGILEDSVHLAESVETRAVFREYIDDVLFLSGTITLDGIDYVAWVLNPALGKFTQYTNYPFNSFVQIGQHAYGVSDDGVYILEGEDDAGVDIAARIRSGLIDFGSATLKNVRHVYIGMSSSGDVVLRTITTREGTRRMDYYLLRPRGSSNVFETRKELSNSIQARYWEFEVENVDGASLEIDEIEWRVVVLRRRI